MIIDKYISDKAIFQQNEPINISGSDFCGSVIKASLKSCASEYFAEAECDSAGNFLLVFPPIAGGKTSFELTIQSKTDKKVFSDILIGEVWIAAGQSNMAYSVRYMANKEDIIKRTSAISDIRILALQDATEFDKEYPVLPSTPLKEVALGGFFAISESEKTLNISGIAVMYALTLYKNLNVPIGIINTAVGGCSIDSYLPIEEIERDGKMKDFLVRNGFYATKYEDVTNKVRAFTMTSGIYNHKIAPILRNKYKGVIWYQGESWANTFEYSQMYQKFLTVLIESYRKLFKQDLTFICSHIAPLIYPNNAFATCHLNEAITNCCDNLENAFAAPLYDVKLEFANNDTSLIYHPIHPTDKKTIADRMALLALNNAYFKKPFAFTKPIDFIKNGKTAVVVFSRPLKLLKGAKTLSGFTMKVNGKFVEAVAKIEKNTVTLSSDKGDIQDYAYAFSPLNFAANLGDDKGFPVMPCRSNLEEAKPDVYLLPNNFLNLENSGTMVNAFGATYSESAQVKNWTNGDIHSSGKAVVLQNTKAATLTIKYNKPNYKNVFLFGASPACVVSGYCHNFDRYDFLDFNLELKGDAEVIFKGLTFISKNMSYKFNMAQNGAVDVQQITLQKNAKQLISINLRSILNCDESLCQDNSVVNDISKMELTFQSVSPCEIVISDFKLK